MSVYNVFSCSHCGQHKRVEVSFKDLQEQETAQIKMLKEMMHTMKGAALLKCEACNEFSFSDGLEFF